MERDRLQQYVEDELLTGKNLVTEIEALDGDSKTNLRHLYGLPAKTKLVYAESGGLTNIDCFPQDTTVIIPVFPWSERDLESSLGSLHRLRGLIESGRVFPIIQHPLYYVDSDHLEFLFDRRTPSYFIRGIYAYSVVLGIAPEVDRTQSGLPGLSAINRLMTHCERAHSTWLQHGKSNEACWEYRYRNQTLRDDGFYSRLHDSLCYRYASVAICIGQHNADEVISVFPAARASEILLHLHILFDHVMCHGLGSDFVVRPDTPDGADFKSTRRSGVTKAHELDVGAPLNIALPEDDDEYVRCLLQEEHFLREIDFALLSRDSLPVLQDKLSRQFSGFRNKIARLSKGKKLLEQSVQVTVYLLSTISMFSGDGLALGAVGFIGGLKVPWLADCVAEALKKIHRDKLASYAINRL